MTRILRNGVVMLVAAGVWIGPPSRVAAQSGADVTASARELLTFSGIRDITIGLADVFTAEVHTLAPDLTAAEERRFGDAIRAEFTPDALYRDVVDYVAREAPPGMIAAALGWLTAGANAELEEVRRGFAPSQTLSEFTTTLRDERPSEMRLRVVTRWVQAHSTADFHIILDESRREAATWVVGALRDDAPDFVELSSDDYESVHGRYMSQAIVEALYRLQPVPDDLIDRATVEYETASGQWFIENYTFGLAEAILLAADRVSVRLRSGRRPTEGGG